MLVVEEIIIGEVAELFTGVLYVLLFDCHMPVLLLLLLVFVLVLVLVFLI